MIRRVFLILVACPLTLMPQVHAYAWEAAEDYANWPVYEEESYWYDPVLAAESEVWPWEEYEPAADYAWEDASESSAEEPTQFAESGYTESIPAEPEDTAIAFADETVVEEANSSAETVGHEEGQCEVSDPVDVEGTGTATEPGDIREESPGTDTDERDCPPPFTDHDETNGGQGTPADPSVQTHYSGHSRFVTSTSEQQIGGERIHVIETIESEWSYETCDYVQIHKDKQRTKVVDIRGPAPAYRYEVTNSTEDFSYNEANDSWETLGAYYETWKDWILIDARGRVTEHGFVSMETDHNTIYIPTGCTERFTYRDASDGNTYVSATQQTNNYSSQPEYVHMPERLWTPNEPLSLDWCAVTPFLIVPAH